MTIYCLYIFDRYALTDTTSILSHFPADLPSPSFTTRHCNCVYYHDWHRTKRPKRANDGGGLLQGVSHALSPLPPPSSTSSVPGSTPGSAPSTPFTSPRNTLSSSSSGVLVALSTRDAAGPSQGIVASRSATPPPLLQTQGAGASPAAAASGSGLPFDEEAKLVYGVILSLRNMIKRLSGRYASSTFFSVTSFFFLACRMDLSLMLSSIVLCFHDHYTGTSRLSAIAHPRTNSTSLKPSQATASSCSAIPTPSRCVSSCVPSTPAPS